MENYCSKDLQTISRLKRPSNLQTPLIFALYHSTFSKSNTNINYISCKNVVQLRRNRERKLLEIFWKYERNSNNKICESNSNKIFRIFSNKHGWFKSLCFVKSVSKYLLEKKNFVWLNKIILDIIAMQNA